MKDLPSIEIERKTGEEIFIGIKKGKLILKDFWQWSSSDLVSNATRGILAEFLVASALGLNKGIRNEWDSYDLKTGKITYNIFRTLIIGQNRKILNLVDTGLLTETIRARLEDLA